MVIPSGETPSHAILYSVKLTVRSEDDFIQGDIVFTLINAKVMAIVLLSLTVIIKILPCLVLKKKKLSLFHLKTELFLLDT